SHRNDEGQTGTGNSDRHSAEDLFRSVLSLERPQRARLCSVVSAIHSVSEQRRRGFTVGRGATRHHHHAAGRLPLPTTQEWGEGKGEGIPISRANSMERTPLPSPLPARASQGEGAGAFQDGDSIQEMRPNNPARLFSLLPLIGIFST